MANKKPAKEQIPEGLDKRSNDDSARWAHDALSPLGYSRFGIFPGEDSLFLDILQPQSEAQNV